MMLQEFEGAILVERVNHLICKGHGSEQERRNWAKDIVKYLCSIGCINTPHWNRFLSIGCFEALPEVSPCESRILQKTIAQEYVEAVALLETNDIAIATHYRTLEEITEILILSRNFRELDEIEYQITGINYSRQESLGEEEANALRRIKLLLCASLYLRGKYFDCSSCFFRLLTNDWKMMDFLNQEPSKKFLTNSELLMMIQISTLLAIPLDNYDDFTNIEELIPFQKICPSLYHCLGLLINTSFGKFFQLWHGDINERCHQSFFLDQNWKPAQCMMREKIYFFYLRVSNYIEISYLSRILGIEQFLVKQEVKNLIDSVHLSFEIQGDTIHYKRSFFLENVVDQLQSNEKLISSKLESRRLKNGEMRDLLQSMIIDNNENNRSIAGDAFLRSDRRELRREDSEMMDLDEINDVSDMDNQSIDIGN
ncbi:hypothetical protein ZYGR_0AI03650 [Zygosaccharomyces rouxii]|uniref:PCI domain-containing protein n=1 Tax=Zygosaccharomyces rouxii TaxID=4956 RepID=A0A1Q3AC16_ZYGRO|nr:hypothetical protein ZYGR_0AI03650 [Zygosaccharomyces rouxii]